MMIRINPANERIKHAYCKYLKQAKGRDDTSIDGTVKAISRFEDSTRRRDFKRFHREQAIAFKDGLRNQLNARTGERLSKATVTSTLRELRTFVFWLAHQPGYKSKILYSDADYFSPSEKDVTVARAKRTRPVPSLEQLHATLDAMPAATVLERRNRALFAFVMLTGARDGAVASFRLKHIDIAAGKVFQDGRDVRTKFARTFETWFFPIGGNALAIFTDWLEELRGPLAWQDDDPLFPAPEMGLDDQGSFTPVGLAKHGWSTADPIRDVFRKAFANAGMPYFNPHSIRNMLAQLAFNLDLTAAQMKAWSQNLGHADVMTTFTSYGTLPAHQQGELIRGLGKSLERDNDDGDDDLAEALEKLLRKRKGSR